MDTQREDDVRYRSMDDVPPLDMPATSVVELPADVPAPAEDEPSPPTEPRFRIKSMRIPGEISPYAPQRHFRITTRSEEPTDENQHNDEGEPTW